MNKIVKTASVFLGLGLLFWVQQAEARSPYWYRAHDARANTRIERQYDKNGDGWISGRERRFEQKARVSSAREFRCDRNHNGFIGAGEAGCL